MDEHGIYFIGVKGKIMLIPFNDSSEYSIYCVKQDDLLYWYKPDGSNNVEGYMAKIIKESE